MQCLTIYINRALCIAIDGSKKDINILGNKSHKIIHKTDVPYTVYLVYSYSSGPNVFHIVYHKKYKARKTFVHESLFTIILVLGLNYFSRETKLSMQ
jgi:hypothetical protein